MTPVSLKLKNNIRTYKSNCIIHQAEKKLLNERIRNINSTTEHLNNVMYMYERDLKVIVVLKYLKNVRSTLKQLKRPGIIKYYSDRFQNLRD